MSKTSLPNDPDLPHVPAIVDVIPDSKCAGCPLSQNAEHKSCSSMRSSTNAGIDNKMEGQEYIAMQWMMHRLGMDGTGPPGILSQPLNGYQGESSSSFAYYSNWEVVSVSDKTIVLEKSGGGDPRHVLMWQYSIPNSENPMINIQGYRVNGSVQPGMVLQFSSNSVLNMKNLPTVVKVESFDVPNSRMTLTLDKTVNSALTYMPGQSGTVTVNIWHFYAYPENWQYHIQPDIFYGVRQTRTIYSTEVPTDGLVVLSTGPVMHPTGFDPTLTHWEIRGRRIDDLSWEAVPTQNDRLFITPTESSVALKTTKPTYGVSSITLADDLTTIYSLFYITYWTYNNGTSPNCKPLGYARCKFSKPEPTGSSAAYASGGNYGWGTNGLCTLRIQTDNSDVQDTDADTYDDTVFPVDFDPSGIERYPLNRLCLQFNSCDGWQAAEGAVDRDDNWQTHLHAGNYYREIWGANDIVVYELLPGVPGLGNRRVKRSMHPSIYGMNGYWGLTTPTGGDHIQTEFPTNGAWAQPYVYTDGSGDHLGWIFNSFNGYKQNDPEADIDGVMAARVAGFKTTRNPVDATSTITERDIERLGFGAVKDEGDLTGRGISQSTVALPAQDLLVAPNVNAEIYDEIQASAVGHFERKSGGLASEVVISPLRQGVKSGVSIGSRTITNVTDLGSGRYELEFANENHSYATYSLGVLTTVTWKGGGVYPIVPFPKQEINNFHESPKTTGSRMRGAWSGDSIGYDGHYFVIESVLPHGGTSAGTWDGGTPQDHYSNSGNYTDYGQLRDIAVVYDENNILSNFTGGEVVTFHWQEAVAMPGAVLEWTQYQSDNWQVVEDATFWHGEGIFKIDDSWFTGKPANLCFRASNLRWLDHRGAVPASLHNKTKDAIMGNWEILTGPGGGYGSVCIGSGATLFWEMDTHPTTGCTTGDWTSIGSSGSDDCSPGNHVSIYSGDGVPDVSTAENSASISSVSGQSLGWPYVFQCIPSDSTIVSVKAEINSSGVTRTKTTTQPFIENCDESVVQEFGEDVVTTLEGLTVSFARITGPDPGDYSIIGSVGLDASELNTSAIIDVTDIYQTIFSDVDSNALGYALIVLPESIAGTGTAADLVPPDPPPLISYSVDCPPGQPCPTAHAKGTLYTELVEWDVCSVTSLWIEIEYSDIEKTRQVLLFRWPDGAPLGAS